MTVLFDDIELPYNFFVRAGDIPGKEKITIGLSNGKQHLTITNNGGRKSVNLHLTNEPRVAGQLPDYLAEFSYFTLRRLFVLIRQTLLPALPGFLFKSTINQKTLVKTGALACPMSNRALETDLFYITNRGKRIISKSKVSGSTLSRMLSRPNHLATVESNGFFLFSSRKKLVYRGFIFTHPSLPDKATFYFISARSQKRLAEFYGATFVAALQK